MKQLMLICGLWLVACCPAWAGDQQSRFIEFHVGGQSVTFDLQTVQFVSPGRFTIIETTIDDPDVMKFELNAITTMRNYCKRPVGNYPAPSDLFQLGQPDLPVPQIKVTGSKNGRAEAVSWEYPYQLLKTIHGNWVSCEEPGHTAIFGFAERYKRITNGYRAKWIWDCTRGLWDNFMGENDDPTKSHFSPVEKGTNAWWFYQAVCRAATHEEPYQPE
jgi:hypothetical protein